MGVRWGWLAAVWLAASAAAAQTVCSQPESCAGGAICLRPVGHCQGEGTCVDGGFDCPALFAPACGCDGRSYPNECDAQRRGTGVVRPGACCVGSCSTDDRVTEADLRLGIAEGLGLVKVLACRSFDRDQSARVTIDELITAVRNAMLGCAPRE